jgi:hypothetical protein
VAAPGGGWLLGGAPAAEFGRQLSNVSGQRTGYRANMALNVAF